jgi:hypothetical protein
MRLNRLLLAGIVLAGTLLINPADCRGGVSISVKPTGTCFCLGETFSVMIFKDSLDIDFDGYQTVITYDPEMLELVSMEEEYVMTDSCWNRWWFPDPGEDTVFVSHVLMCGGISVTGPGPLSSMTFTALQQGSTTISCDYFWLTHEGYWFKDIDWHDCVLDIGQAGVETGSGFREGDLRIEAFPNPGRSFRIRVAGDPARLASLESATLQVCDIEGRIVATIWSGNHLPVTGHSAWDGRHNTGMPAPPGVYFIRLQTPAGCLSQKVILAR